MLLFHKDSTSCPTSTRSTHYSLKRLLMRNLNVPKSPAFRLFAYMFDAPMSWVSALGCSLSVLLSSCTEVTWVGRALSLVSREERNFLFFVCLVSMALCSHSCSCDLFFHLTVVPSCVGCLFLGSYHSSTCLVPAPLLQHGASRCSRSHVSEVRLHL